MYNLIPSKDLEKQSSLFVANKEEQRQLLNDVVHSYLTHTLEQGCVNTLLKFDSFLSVALPKARRLTSELLGYRRADGQGFEKIALIKARGRIEQYRDYLNSVLFPKHKIKALTNADIAISCDKLRSQTISLDKALTALMDVDGVDDVKKSLANRLKTAQKQSFAHNSVFAFVKGDSAYAVATTDNIDMVADLLIKLGYSDVENIIKI